MKKKKLKQILKEHVIAISAINDAVYDNDGAIEDLQVDVRGLIDNVTAVEADIGNQYARIDEVEKVLDVFFKILEKQQDQLERNAEIRNAQAEELIRLSEVVDKLDETLLNDRIKHANQLNQITELLRSLSDVVGEQSSVIYSMNELIAAMTGDDSPDNEGVPETTNICGDPDCYWQEHQQESAEENPEENTESEGGWALRAHPCLCSNPDCTWPAHSSENSDLYNA